MHRSTYPCSPAEASLPPPIVPNNSNPGNVDSRGTCYVDDSLLALERAMKQTYSDKIDRIVQYLNEQVTATPTLQDLADIAHISPFHFHRVYRATTGETPSGTLRRLRIARAVGLLRDTDKPITTIAFDVGYDSSQAFSKAFRQVTGHSASSVRKNKEVLDQLMGSLSGPPGPFGRQPA